MACMDVCPLASELSVINSNILCPEEGCGKIFKASSALNMHLTKHHRNSCLTKRDSSILVRYFCPEENCIYHVNASRHFSQMKYLKQHYLKVHSEKRFSCESCSKAFATQELLKSHLQICGVKFICSCGNSYSSYEALLTHSKRKQHIFDDKYKSSLKRTKSESGLEVPGKNDSHCFSVDTMQPIYILPKLICDQMSVGLNILATSTVTDVSTENSSLVHDKSMQTDPMEPRRRKISSSQKTIERTTRRQTSAQTQAGGTLKSTCSKKSAETQTMGDCILKKAMEDADIVIQGAECPFGLPSHTRKRKYNSGTQTAVKRCSKFSLKATEPVLEESLDAMSLSSSTSYCVKKDIGLPDLWLADKSNCGTQTTSKDHNILESSDFTKTNTIHNGLNLELFDQERNLCSSSNIQSIFEDNSVGFDDVANSTSFDSEQHPEAPVSSIQCPSDHRYGSSNVTETDQNLNHLFLRHPTDAYSASFTTTETQTTEDLAVDDLDSLLYSNMWTQTSEDPLFPGLDFADIQTQTAWPMYSDEPNTSVLVSAETQTAISSSTYDVSSSLIDNECWYCEPSHIETQTCEEDLKDYIAELDAS